MVAEIVPDLPEDDAFDLDSLANEANETAFVFKTSGERFELLSPMDLDWTEVEEMQAEALAGHLKRVFQLLMPPGQYEKFLQQRVPTWKLVELMTAWSGHYGVSLGESQASSPRSVPKRRR